MYTPPGTSDGETIYNAMLSRKPLQTEVVPSILAFASASYAKQMLKDGHDVNARDFEGRTALILAASEGLAGRCQ